MWKRAEICDEKCDHGGFAVSISSIVHPKDQTSAGRPWPVCRITSGAIQYGVPVQERGEKGDGMVW